MFLCVDYVNEHKELMMEILDNLPPYPVMSQDGTFNTNKRTLEQQEIPESERRPAGRQSRKVVLAPVEEKTTMLCIGVNGQVLCFFVEDNYQLKLIYVID